MVPKTQPGESVFRDAINFGSTSSCRSCAWEPAPHKIRPLSPGRRNSRRSSQYRKSSPRRGSLRRSSPRRGSPRRGSRSRGRAAPAPTCRSPSRSFRGSQICLGWQVLAQSQTRLKGRSSSPKGFPPGYISKSENSGRVMTLSLTSRISSETLPVQACIKSRRCTCSPKEQWTFPMCAICDKRSRSICVDDPTMNKVSEVSAPAKIPCSTSLGSLTMETPFHSMRAVLCQRKTSSEGDVPAL